MVALSLILHIIAFVVLNILRMSESAECVIECFFYIAHMFWGEINSLVLRPVTAILGNWLG